MYATVLKMNTPASGLACGILATGEPNVALPPKVGLLPKSGEPPKVAVPPKAG